MKTRDAAVAIVTDRNLTVEEIEGIIEKVIAADRAARECCKYNVREERLLWERVCKNDAYWLTMVSKLCNQQGDAIGASRWIGAAAAVEGLIEKRAKTLYK